MILVARSPLQVPYAQMQAARETLERTLRDAGHQLTFAQTPYELLDMIAGARALYVNAPLRADAQVIQAGRALEVVVCGGAGYDHVDVAAATSAGIPVVTTGSGSTVAVAEHTMLLMLSLSRNSVRADALMRQGSFAHRWSAQQHELRGRTVTVVGQGRIGRRTSDLSAAFGMRVHRFPEASRWRRLSRDEMRRQLRPLLRRSDFVTLHLPLTEATWHLIGEEELMALPPNAHLINTARGGLVDEAALVRALVAGALGGAGLDVFESEPLRADSPLLGLDNVVLTPHCAGVTVESVRRMARVAATAIIAVLAGRRPAGVVNPEALTAPARVPATVKEPSPT